MKFSYFVTTVRCFEGDFTSMLLVRNGGLDLNQLNYSAIVPSGVEDFPNASPVIRLAKNASRS